MLLASAIAVTVAFVDGTCDGAAPWITGSLLLGGLAVLGAGRARRRDDWRRHATFPGPESGASFPCDHLPVDFLYGEGRWIWRKRRPTAPESSSAVGLVTGLALGFGRMAAGGHFLSDALWSALLAFGVCHLLYVHELRLHRIDESIAAAAMQSRTSVRWRLAGADLVVLAAIGVLVALVNRIVRQGRFTDVRTAKGGVQLPMQTPSSIPATSSHSNRTSTTN